MKSIETTTKSGQKVTHSYSYCWFDKKVCPESYSDDTVKAFDNILGALEINLTLYRVDRGAAKVCYLVTTNGALGEKKARTIYQQLVKEGEDASKEQYTARMRAPYTTVATLDALDD